MQMYNGGLVAVMSNKDKIRVLKEYINLAKEYEELVEFYDKKRYSMPSKIITDMPTSHGASNKVESNQIQYETMCDIVFKRLEDLESKKYRIEMIISNIDNSSCRRLLHMRYIQGLTFETISVNMNYSWRQTHRIHSRSLDKVMMS